MLTTMGIRAANENIPFPNASAEVTKIMGANPRRVTGITVVVNMAGLQLTEEQKKIMEETALNCPVAKSLHPEIRQDVSFVY